MTDIEHDGGWEILHSSHSDGSYFVTVRMVSVEPCKYSEYLTEKFNEFMATHSHRKSAVTDWFEFDHEPTMDEIQAAVDATGFDPHLPDIPAVVGPVLAGNPIVAEDGSIGPNTMPIRTITEGEEDVLEYSVFAQPKEFQEIFDMVPIEIVDLPSSICIKGDWIHLYYARLGSPIPTQFFDEQYFGYSVRIHKDTGQILRKGYRKGLTLTPEELAGLEGASELISPLITGYYLDEPRVTIYSLKSEAPEHAVYDPGIVEVPYIGTTWENGVKVRVREYTRVDPTAL